MSMFKYLFSTSWNQKLADWKEYKNLKSALQLTETEEGQAKKAISLFHTYEEWLSRRKIFCINYIEDSEPEIGPDFVKVYCKNFTNGICKNNECSLKKANDNYATICIKKMNIQNSLDSFWSRKLNNIK
ncbi:MAG: hypothetical protein IKW67_02970 [Alphaproteobacteria bacterium]|nr:hypothetical protein [Alphaproteobacteria bacterium]